MGYFVRIFTNSAFYFLLLCWVIQCGHLIEATTSGDQPADSDEHLINPLPIYLGFRQFSISRLIPGFKQWSRREFDLCLPSVFLSLPSCQFPGSDLHQPESNVIHILLDVAGTELGPRTHHAFVPSAVNHNFWNNNKQNSKYGHF